MDDEEGFLLFGGTITALIVFVGSWIYCIATYGFLLGVGLGWLPSMIVAVIAYSFFPLIAFLLGMAILYFLYFLLKGS